MSVLGSLRARLGRPGDLGARLDGLEAAVEAARGRLAPDVVEDAAAVVARARDRLRLSPDHTVVALGGATGSGKSSLFNALSGLDLAVVGVRRPTTSFALACVWGDGADELLEWLEIPARHQVNRASSLDGREPQQDLQGLVLLDLPDHDSIEVSHHLEVERLVALADVLVWVLDPQKYADSAIHDIFLRPLARHRDVLLVVFNRIDELAPDALAAALADARRLLALDGLGDVALLATSATRGDGLAALREAVAGRVAAKRQARDRISADIVVAAGRLVGVGGSADPSPFGPGMREELVDACAEAAGVPVAVAALEASWRRRAGQQTGWPMTRWLSRLKPDPLRRLHLVTRGRPTMGRGLTGAGANGSGAVGSGGAGSGGAGSGGAGVGAGGSGGSGGVTESGLPTGATSEATSAGPPGRTSLPAASPVQRARIASAVRISADSVSAGLSVGWSGAVRDASLSRMSDVPDRLDSAVSSVDLGAARAPRWWGALRGVQWVLLAAVVVGAVWLTAVAAVGYLGLPRPDGPRWRGVLAPTWMLVGGVVVALVVAALGRWAGGVSARRHARTADRRLRAAVSQVVDELLVAPMESEVDAYRRCRAGVEAALGD